MLLIITPYQYFYTLLFHGIHLLTCSYSFIFPVAGCAHAAAFAVPAAGRYTVLFIFYQLEYNSGHYCNKDQRNHYIPKICHYPCDHLLSPFPLSEKSAQTILLPARLTIVLAYANRHKV